MFPKQKGWFGGVWKPKNPHSLEHLKYLYTVLNKNQTVTENNTGLLVETLRSISEILIWGDQNDSSVFDFFLEKNMLVFFIRYLRQKYGRYICVQLLQTLNILFENIRNETSVYYLLSNNHINAIIEHKFDFSDEEVMAYYISFLKTLSLKLNKHTIHFFYNEHTNDFALYTEAIKFFNHSESMVRIAVRTITLNVFKVDDKAMLRYIRDRTAAPYFSNLVWFIGNHILELDSCVRNDADHRSRDRLADLVAEHLDHLHYLNDILCLNIDSLNGVLTDHLLNRLLIPLYVSSMLKSRHRDGNEPRVSSVVSLFLLSQVFLILSHKPLVQQLTQIIFSGYVEASNEGGAAALGRNHPGVSGFVAPEETLAETLESRRAEGPMPRRSEDARHSGQSTFYMGSTEEDPVAGTSDTVDPEAVPADIVTLNTTDDEKLLNTDLEPVDEPLAQVEFSLVDRPYLEAIFNALECVDNDYQALFALCLLYALGHNPGINQQLLDSVFMPTDKSESKEHYNVNLVERLIKIVTLGCQPAGRVRLATLEMSILLLKQLVYGNDQDETICYLQDRHLACVEGAKEESMLMLRNYYKSEEMFLDMFEDDFRELMRKPLNVEYLTMDASILLPPTGTPLTGIDFNKRLPCGEVERARRAIRVFFLVRNLSLTLCGDTELQLPLTKSEDCVSTEDALDLNNSDLIACTVISKDNKKDRRFLVIDVHQVILVEPDTKRLGWGIVKFVGFLQDIEVTGDKEDSRSLHVTIHRPTTSSIHARPTSLLAARFVFDDHIRCMAAKQRLTKGRLKARQRKMQMISRLLDAADMMDTPAPPSAFVSPLHSRDRMSFSSVPGRVQAVSSQVPAEQRTSRSGSQSVQQSVFASVEQVPGFQNARQQNNQSGSRAGSGQQLRSHPVLARPRSNAMIGSPEVEQGVEATSAFAFQTLHPSSPRHSRPSSDSSSQVEIPLEDLSRRRRRKSETDSPTRERHRTGSGTPRECDSPRPMNPDIVRTQDTHDGPYHSQEQQAANTLQSTSVHLEVYQNQNNEINISDENTLSGQIGDVQASHSIQTLVAEQNNRTLPNTDNYSQNARVSVDTGDSENGEMSAHHLPLTKRRSSSGPKSLTRHEAPALSLVTGTDGTACLAQLLPPADNDRLRSYSDPGSPRKLVRNTQTIHPSEIDDTATVDEHVASETIAVIDSEIFDSVSNEQNSTRPLFYKIEDKPTVRENLVNAEKVEKSASSDLNATEQLRRNSSVVD